MSVVEYEGIETTSNQQTIVFLKSAGLDTLATSARYSTSEFLSGGYVAHAS